MVKFPREKEAILIDEDTFPPVALINTISFDLKALMNSKKARDFPPSHRIIKVWIPKQYLTYKNDLVVVKEKKKNKGIQTIHLEKIQ